MRKHILLEEQTLNRCTDFDFLNDEESLKKLNDARKKNHKILVQQYNDNSNQKSAKWKKEVKEICSKRQIEYLIHFTKAFNLKGIMEHGLLNAEMAFANGFRPKTNDNKRIDGREGICLSVTFPNYKNFFRFRQSCQDVWVIILLDPKIIEDKLCKFYFTNASNKLFIGRDKYDLMDIEDFSDMFLEWGGDKWPRNKVGTTLNEPTNPQAEIRVLEGIETDYIKRIIVEEGYLADVQEYLDHKYDDILFEESEVPYIRLDGKQVSYFAPRPDYKCWYRE